MTGTPTAERLQQIRNRADTLRTRAEAELLEIRAARGPDAELTTGEAHRIAQMERDYRALVAHGDSYESELRRAEIPPQYAKLGTRGGREARANSAARLSPLGFSEETLRNAYDRARRGESVALETRDFASGSSLLPPQLYPIPTFPVHEARLLSRLVGIQLDSPALEYVQVNTVSGAAAIVGEGQPKSELSLPATKLICPALKLAIHAGVSWENMQDFDSFTASVQNELMKQCVDLENAQLWGGDPAAGGLNSFTKTAGILTYQAALTGENWTDLAQAVNVLRTGPCLCEPDLLLCHPDTWTALRVQKDWLRQVLFAGRSDRGRGRNGLGRRCFAEHRFRGWRGRVGGYVPRGPRGGARGPVFADRVRK